jgi:hypothetical protein
MVFAALPSFARPPSPVRANITDVLRMRRRERD